MDQNTFRLRTKQFGLKTILLVNSLPHSRANDVISSQLLRSSTSVGANYRAACRAKSAADMTNKLKIVEEEADESVYWLELLVESGTVSEQAVSSLIKEGNELVAMTVASIKTLRARLSRQS